MLLVFLTALWGSCYSSNIDVESPLVIKGEQAGSLFGYSALMHRFSNSTHVYLVGAPRANTSQNLVNPGAVFQCRGQFGELKTTVPCDGSHWLSVFDSADDTIKNVTIPYKVDNKTYYEEKMKTTETKSGQLFGVTLTRTNNSIIGCANRYIDHYGKKKVRLDKRLPIGRCIAVSLELNEFQDNMYPCKDIADSHESYGSCQAGTSVGHHGKKISISAPNANNGLGNSFLYQQGAATPDKNILELITDTWKGSTVTLEKPRAFSLDYAGYSTVFCDVNGDGTKELILGMPRAAYYKGSIRVHIGSLEEQQKFLELEDTVIIREYLHLVEKRLDNSEYRDTNKYKNLGILCPSGHPDHDCYEPVGPQMGSYFGHTMTCGDLNDDGLDDLVISAPYFSDVRNMITDIGQVAIYFGSKTDDFNYPFPNFDDKETKTLFGNKKDSGLFGYSLNCEGDLNFDGIKDLIVGAPYEDDGKGAVYIFNGGKEYFDDQSSQVIKPLQLSENLRGFGSAISSGYNIDDKAGDELLVGSFLSDTVVIMRTIPTMEITPSLILFHKSVNLEVPNYINKDGEKSVGTTLNVNISTIGLGVRNNTMRLYWKLILDPAKSDLADKRAYFSLEDDPAGKMLYTLNGSIVLQPEKIISLDKEYNVLLKRDTIRDIKNLHIDIEGSIEPFINPGHFSNKWALKYELFRQARATIAIKTNCSEDTGVCTSDVGITRFETQLAPLGSEFPRDKIVINKIQYVNVFVTLENKGPDQAYDTVFTLNLPAELVLLSPTDLHGVACEEGEGMNKVECIVDGVFDPGTKNVMIELYVNNTQLSHTKSLELRGKLAVGSPSNDSDLSDNEVSLTMQSVFLADIRLQGGTDKTTQPFTNSIIPSITGPKTFEDIGPEVKHSLSVSVEELIDVESVPDIELHIRWPLKKSSQYVLYLTEIHIPHQYRDLIQCETKYVNQLGLKPSSAAPPEDSGPKSFTSEDPEPEVVEGQLFGYDDDVSFDCSSLNDSCQVVKCRIPELRRGSYNKNEVKLEIRSRLWESTFKNQERILLTSYSRIESVGMDLVLPILKKRAKATTSKFYLPNERKALNMTIIILSALAGLVIVAVIVFVLWKKGFFKSNYFNRTPSNMFQTGARRETLNRQIFSSAS